MWHRNGSAAAAGRRRVAAAAVATVVATTGGGVARAHVPPAGNWSLRFADEFGGSSLDPMKWNDNYPWSQHGLADDSVEQASQVSVGNGAMSLTAVAQGQWYNNNWYDYTSGAVNTQGKLNFTYGYVEASQKMPAQQGTWPAFWMLQNGWPPEIDVQEVRSNTPNQTSYSSGYHYSDASGNAASAGPSFVNEYTDLSANYHTYGVDWEPTSLTFYFDGRVTGSISGSQANIAQAAGQYLLIDLGVGGWPGNPPAGTGFPAVMQTDWVRVWQQLPGGAAASTSTWTKAAGGSWDDATGWTNGVPTVSATTATFAAAAAATATVDWSGSRTVNGLSFASGTAYTLGATANGGAGLMIAPADGVPTAAETVTIAASPSGSAQVAPTINARVEVPYALETLAVNNTTTAPLLFNGDLIGPGGLTVVAGIATVNGNDQMTGPVAVTGGATLVVNGKVSAASQVLVANGSVRLNPGSAVTANSWASVGNVAGNTGRLNVTGGAVTADTDFNVGDVAGSAGYMTMSAGTLAVQTYYVGKSGNAVGVVTQSGGAVSTLAGNADWRVGGAFSSADAAATGTYNLSGGTVVDAGNLQVGAYGRGTVNQTGGSVTVGNYLSIGRYAGGVGAYNMAAGTGTLSANAVPTLIVGEAGTGTLTVGGSSYVYAKSLALGAAAGGVGTVNQTGGFVTAPTAGVTLGAVGTGTYNLAGGVLLAPAVTRGTGTGTLYLNGGTLRAAGNTAALVAGLSAARVGAGGARVDTNGYAVTLPQTLTPDPALPAGTSDGGLTKLGTGTLTLTGAQAYAGPTVVAAGTLALAPTASVAAASAVTVTAGATLSLAAPTTAAPLVRRFAALTVAGTATVGPAAVAAAVAPATAGVTLLVTPSLAVPAGGTLDLANGDLDVAGGTLAAVSALIANGSVYSSTAAADPLHLHALAAVTNADPVTGLPLFGAGATLGPLDGTSPAGTDVLVRYAYLGDATLNGNVDGADYSRVDAGYASQSTAAPLTGWFNGDFNGDGSIDGSDYTLIDNAFDLQPAPAAAPSVASVPIAAITSEVAAVPEPAAVALAAVAATLATRRRR